MLSFGAEALIKEAEGRAGAKNKSMSSLPMAQTHGLTQACGLWLNILQFITVNIPVYHGNSDQPQPGSMCCQSHQNPALLKSWV